MVSGFVTPEGSANAAARLESGGGHGVGLRDVNVDAQLETGFTNLVLQCEAHELSFVVPERSGERSRAARAYGAATMLDVVEMSAGDPESLGEGCQAFAFALPKRGKRSART